jgi:predicted nucleic acid-binding Zn ribbon protein
MDNEEGVCDSESCIKINDKRQKSRKRWGILLYVFAGIFFLSIIFQYMNSGT